MVDVYMTCECYRNTTSHSSASAGTEAPIVTHSYQDTNGDGRLVVVMQFRTQSTGIQCGDTMSKLTGQTTGGAQFTGADVIRTVGCK
jgi:hypothetical protein